MSVDEDTVARKRSLRRELLAQRRAIPPESRRALGAAVRDAVLTLPELVEARTVTAYVSVQAEPDTTALLETLLARRRTVLLPITLPDMSLDWVAYEGPASLHPAAHGLLEPRGTRLGADAVKEADLALLPALAVDVSGLRMGRGGGCYDRVLATLPPDVLSCALCYDHELLPRVPAEPHDRRVGAVATPSGTTRF
ncbi:MAG TPA: 5-formyltetrahydrofolate cyclo-ligase [Streptosporangiales bacterium]